MNQMKNEPNEASVNCPGPAKPPVEPPVKPPIEPVEPSPPGSCSPLGTFKCSDLDSRFD